MSDIGVSKLTQAQLDAHFVLSVRQNDGLAKYWLDAGANVNGKLDWNENVLIYAILNDNEELFDILIDAGADVNGTDRFMVPVLFYALDDVKWLNKLAAQGNLNVNVRDYKRYGITPMTHAYETENEAVADRLIELGINLNVPTHEDMENNILIWSIQDDGKWLDKFLNAGIDLNTAFRFEGTALHLAVEKSKNTIASKLIDAKADVNATNAAGETPLMITDSFEVAKKLIENGADVNARDKKGYTALIKHVDNCYYSNYDEKIKIIKLLLKHGANTKTEAADGACAISIAKRKREKEIVDLIKKSRKSNK